MTINNVTSLAARRKPLNDCPRASVLLARDEAMLRRAASEARLAEARAAATRLHIEATTPARASWLSRHWPDLIYFGILAGLFIGGTALSFWVRR